MQYEAILVDLDGVIRTWRPSDEAIESAFGLPAGSIRRAAFSPELLDQATTGAITDEEWREQTAQKLQRKLGIARARKAVAQWGAHPGEVDHEVLSLLTACDRSLKLVLVTNATSRLPRDLEALGLSERFHAIVNSSQVRLKKPSEGIFRLALQRAGVGPASALFIDDTAVNVAAASALGIRGHTFIGHGQLSSFLLQAGALSAEAL